MPLMPTIHVNGSHPDDLTVRYANAFTAVSAAINAVALAAPNGRDYYPQGDGAITEAMEDHARRIRSLERVRDELLAIHQGIDEQAIQQTHDKRRCDWPITTCTCGS